MDHAARVAARAEREVIALEEGDAEPAKGEVARDACSVDAATDDGHVHRRGGERLLRDRHREGRGKHRDWQMRGHGTAFSRLVRGVPVRQDSGVAVLLQRLQHHFDRLALRAKRSSTRSTTSKSSRLPSCLCLATREAYLGASRRKSRSNSASMLSAASPYPSSSRYRALRICSY